MLSEVQLTSGFDYMLVERGQIPFFAASDRYEQVGEREAERMVVEAILESRKGVNWDLLHFLEIDQHPTYFHPEDLRHLIVRQMRYLGHDLYRRVRAPMNFELLGARQTQPKAAAAAVTVKPRAYVIAEVVSKAEKPQPGVRIELTAPDGSVNTLITDARGQATLRGIDPGSCVIVLPTLDQSRWTADGSQGQLLRKESARTHVVKPGECLTQLAHANGIADWHKIWDHPDNATLKAKRKSPNVLLPGDRVAMPGLDVAQIERPTDATHRITVDTEPFEVEVAFTFSDHLGDALADEPYELTYGQGDQRTKKAGHLSGSGELREKVPAGLMTADLLLTRREEVYSLALGHLDPAHEDGEPVASGAAARLGALGYLMSHGQDPSANELRAAVRRFQRDVLERPDPTGDLDSETCAKLEDTHGA